MEEQGLLSEFPPVSTEAWERAIAGDLKGGSSATLRWQAEEGLDIRPYYRAENGSGLEYLKAAPGEFPYGRGAHARAGWRIREKIDAADPEEANRAALETIAGGADEIAFGGAKLENASDLGLLLVNLTNVPIHFEGADQHAARLILERLKNRQHAKAVTADLNWSVNPQSAAELIARSPGGFAPFAIDAGMFAECGAGRIEEAGFALASAVDFVVEMKERGVSADRAAGAIHFSFAMGSRFLVEIAKLRAFRMMWAQAAEILGIAAESAKARIHARTSKWSRTLYDPHVNILRATTEAMAAVVGGADSVSIEPYDACYTTPDNNSRRLARNIQLILKHEAQLARVADPGGGSYYLEAVTSRIASESWDLFQKIEIAGGYRKAVAGGAIAQALEQHRAARQSAVDCRRQILTGTNRFADAREKTFDRIGVARAEWPGRAAQSFEALRLRTEEYVRRTGAPPRILLAEIGDAKMRAARSEFAADLLACAGLPSQMRRFESAAAIATAEADVIVLCSSDSEYLAIGMELLDRLRERKRNPLVLVAGNPESAEQLKAGGVADFLHIRRNAVEFLATLLQRMGIGEEQGPGIRDHGPGSS